MIKVDIISNKSNTLELQVKSMLRQMAGGTSLEAFKSTYHSEVKKLKRFAYCQVETSYKLVEKNGTLEVWWVNSYGDLKRLVSIISDDGKPSDNPLMYL